MLKEIFGVFNSSKKTNEKKSTQQYYDTSGRIVFVRVLEELWIPQNPFEINWPLAIWYLPKIKNALLIYI